MRIKICRTCNKELTIDLYAKPNMGSCRKCTNIKQKEDRLKNLEKRKEGARLSYYKKREENLARAKAYAEKTKESKAEYDKQYRQENKEKIAEYKKQYANENAEQIAERMKIYRQENGDKLALEKSQYAKNNRLKINAKSCIYQKQRCATDPLFKLIKNTRKMVSRYMLGEKSKRTQEIIGCSYEELKTYIENQFTEGMSWDNYGMHGWHVDHIKPLAMANSEEEIIVSNHYSNLQPMWALDNLKKGATFDGVNYKTKQ
jgi:ATP-dependent 26S proteasome regulatory subunit